ncbi:oxygen-independent coproporphyrinogen III oxidase [Sunxiuqinia elliptica]|uniref:Coproporphyrinogen-III oxidase n=1 Tax=Sunxiuqinia elliptica TaxID=655355 RepID=A0A4V3BXM6_9BACT|nr:oxygen-independent coproporphyrinogen III oxidase [Sunxiuqinia elliptica]TDN99068.1 oxygen-independent coproporphyrinogen-3 oxidase [Sunxiuqinia elliptica]TDO56508.1 oxygen-independent coproporphyrinogen-3 oxidase [Sunxiuqinia elliptica]
MKIPVPLIDKYNVPVPRYTSYPPANFFGDDFVTGDYLLAVEESNEKEPENISIYLHVPFCTQLCLYCGCNTHITKDQDMMQHYMDALKKEIHMIGKLLDRKRKISQIHWGGGTPNVLPAQLIGEVMAIFTSEYEFIDKPEIAIECNPAHLDEAYIDALISFGFTRISLGVQDFQEKVLNAVHREVPEIPIEELVKMIRKHPGVSVNLDFIYGLPYQTVESFAGTMEKAITINPDRLVTFSYAHVPWVKKAQKKLEDYGLPSPENKVKMFEEAWARMTRAGYIPIGLDHYAKPDDDMAVALKNRSLHRNFQGYCTRETTGQVYAFGVTGISQLEDVYAQNARTVKEYIDQIDRGMIQVVKGYALSDTDKIIRQIINEIMCNQYLSWTQIAEQFNTSVETLKDLLNFNEEKLDEFVADDLLSYTEDEIVITDLGRFFLRNIAAVFDIRLEGSIQKFSKSV